MSEVDLQKAKQLQSEYRSKCCPICLEAFDYGDTNSTDVEHDEAATLNQAERVDGNETVTATKDTLIDQVDSVSSFRQNFRMISPVDEYGVPRRGYDGKKIKILRCGHIFCFTCWTNWVHSGCGKPSNCPVCRQDVGKSSTRNRRIRIQLPLQTSHEESASGVVSEIRPNESYGSMLSVEAGDGEGIHRDSSRLIHVDTLLGGTVSFRRSTTREQSLSSSRLQEDDRDLPPVDESTSLLCNNHNRNDDYLP